MEVKFEQYRADMLCEVCGTLKNAIIEVQFTRSDHKHNGQILGYGDENTACKIWIAPEFDPVHLANLRGLNEGRSECKYFAVIAGESWSRETRPGLDPAWIPSFRVAEAPKRWELRKQAKLVRAKDDRHLWASFWQSLKDRFPKDSIIRTMHASTGPTTVFESLPKDFRLGATSELGRTRSSVFCLMPFNDYGDDWIVALRRNEKPLREKLRSQISHVDRIKIIERGIEQSALEIFTNQFDASDITSWETQHHWIRDSLHILQGEMLIKIRDIEMEFHM
ncbi:MAG: hypothetical protein KF836_09375 [Fimbriimonadaceae bacterium]|nr:hypothetical protein [Fimbriimonadaceae bacterium]